MSTQKTVQVCYLEQENIILMQWEHLIYREDVRAAFETVSQLLDESPVPIYVVVDISSNPQFPLTETVNGAINGPARNPKLKGWLVIGKNNLARIIGRTISSLTGDRNIHWFDSYDAVSGFLRQPNRV